MCYEDYDYCDPYDGDDLEALGQKESWEHSRAEMESMEYGEEQGDLGSDSYEWEDDQYELDDPLSYCDDY